MADSTGDSVTQQAKQTSQMILDGSSEIFSAAALGQLDHVVQCLAADPTAVHQRAPDGKTPLHLAAQWGQLEVARLLLSQGASAAGRDQEGRTPLHSLTGHATRLDLLELLLEHGADPNAADQFGNTALFLAASLIHHAGHDWGAHDWLAERLLQRGARLDAFAAVILNRAEELAALLDDHPRLLRARKRHGYIPDGSTLLHFAADRGHVEVTRLLLERGADVLATDSRGRPPLYLAGHNGGARKASPTPEAMALLLEHGAPLDVFGSALLGRVDRLEELMGADPGALTAEDAGGSTPLHLAAWNGQAEAAAWLVKHGAGLNAANARGETPLALAAGYGHAVVVALLLERGATCSVPVAITLARPDLLATALRAEPAAAGRANRYGRTPAQLAAEAAMWAHTTGSEAAAKKQLENLDLLLEHGAALEIWAAAALNRVEGVEHLLASQPALVNLPDNGSTPLHMAAAMGHADLAGSLIHHGAALEARDYAGATPLRRAAGFIPGVGRGSASTVAVLLNHGANREPRNNWHDTPFGVALGTPAAAEVFLEHGEPLTVWAAAALGRDEALQSLLAEDPQRLHATGPFGFTPLNWAVVNGQLPTIRYLLAQGAQLHQGAWGRSLLTWAKDCGQSETAALLREHGLKE